MKIGSSISRCVRDIYEGTVDIRDVLVVIARTDFDPEDDKQWRDLWRGYAGGDNLWEHTVNQNGIVFLQKMNKKFEIFVYLLKSQVNCINQDSTVLTQQD